MASLFDQPAGGGLFGDMTRGQVGLFALAQALSGALAGYQGKQAPPGINPLQIAQFMQDRQTNDQRSQLFELERAKLLREQQEANAQGSARATLQGGFDPSTGVTWNQPRAGMTPAGQSQLFAQAFPQEAVKAPTLHTTFDQQGREGRTYFDPVQRAFVPHGGTKAPTDYTLGSQRFSGATDQPIATGRQAPPTGFRYTAGGGVEPIPGYVEGQGALASAKRESSDTPRNVRMPDGSTVTLYQGTPEFDEAIQQGGRLASVLSSNTEGEQGLTTAQQRHNATVDQARETLSAMSLTPEDVRRMSEKFSDTGRDNPDYRENIGRLVDQATTRKNGDDPGYEAFYNRYIGGQDVPLPPVAEQEPAPSQPLPSLFGQQQQTPSLMGPLGGRQTPSLMAPLNYTPIPRSGSPASGHGAPAGGLVTPIPEMSREDLQKLIDGRGENLTPQQRIEIRDRLLRLRGGGQGDTALGGSPLNDRLSGRGTLAGPMQLARPEGSPQGVPGQPRPFRPPASDGYGSPRSMGGPSGYFRGPGPAIRDRERHRTGQAHLDHVAARFEFARRVPASQRSEQDWQDIETFLNVFGAPGPAAEYEQSLLEQYRQRGIKAPKSIDRENYEYPAYPAGITYQSGR